MSYQVFARKYRPKTFEDVLGQDHVVQTLRNAILKDRLAHAYLFVGPRGTGKTSTARIFAKALNCSNGPNAKFDPNEPICIEIAEGRSLDVLEIDGASNNGIEQVRQLQESANYAPSNGKFKIFYIDEVHMLSKSAFNALLKTLEEPPPYVKFIFATTEVHKILPTILSRCQRFDLRPIPSATIVKHLLHIAQIEGIKLDENAAWAIAHGADGGMRDAQSMLDQLVAFCGEHISEAQVLDIFGFTSKEKVATLIESLLLRDASSALSLVEAEAESGRDLSQLVAELMTFLRSILVALLDTNQKSDGISIDMWKHLQVLAKDYPIERLLASIDTLADTEARLKWATNKRLHVELGMIKTIQTLSQVSISSVINTLLDVSKDTHFQENTQARQPLQHAAPQAPAPVIAATPPLIDEPTPQPVAVIKIEPKKPSRAITTSKSILDSLDSMIEQAPEFVEDLTPISAISSDSPPPWEESSHEENSATLDQKAALEEAFYSDPLILAALEKFEGKILYPQPN